MLKTHLKPIIAYFSHSADGSEGPSSVQVGSKQDNHCQSVINYFVEVDRPVDSHQPSASKFATFFGQLWHNLMTINMDPQIKQRFDRSGQPYWDVYDPISAEHYSFFDEEEVYQWLERRYYQ